MSNLSIRPVVIFLAGLSAALDHVQNFLSEMDWKMSPSSCYQLMIELIDFCRDQHLMSFDQPSWGMLQEILMERRDKIQGSPKDEYLTQTLNEWKNFTFASPNQVVKTVTTHMTPITYGASSLWHELTDRDTDIMGRSLTLGEAVNVLWHVFNQVCRVPFMQMRHPQVPKWTILRPWAQFCRDEIYQLREELKDTTPALSGPIGSTPFSMPEV